MAEVTVDVCVVGAGFAGLTAAHRIRAAGRSVVVLEARDRVGGRTWTENVGGVAVDRGGGWLAPSHAAALALAGELGVTTYRTHVAGRHLLVHEGTARPYRGLIPKISPRAIIQITAAQRRIDKMSRRIDIDAPWSSPDATTWDARTVASWLGEVAVASPAGRDLLEMAVRGLFAADLEEVSLLNLAFLVAAHGSIEKLFSISGGSQDSLVVGGLGAVAVTLASHLGDDVHLGAPVTAIRVSSESARVTTAHEEVTARRVVIATPPALTRQISMDPMWPADRARLYALAVAGQETKTMIVYDRPFWRDDRWSGQSAEPDSLAEVTIDSSPPDASAGVLASFCFGRAAERATRLTVDERRTALLACLAARFGSGAATPRAVVETEWWHDEWSRGCSMAHYPMGALSTLGHLLRAPLGVVHFAGTETAATSHGAVDGAVRSGERAAAEVLSALGT